jgi:hypothetical protein
MQLWGAAMVRNEADVVEAFVRHNLGVLDGLALIDHGSCDGTAEILAALQRERLPLLVERDDGPAFRQPEHLSRTARALLRERGAEFVFALDADEFLRALPRARLEEALAAVPAGMHALVHWATYVPETFAEGVPFGASHLRRRLKEERQPPLARHKVVVGRAFLERDSDRIADGNHFVVGADERFPGPHARIRRDVAVVAHCPVRSRTQLESKVILGHLSYRARPSGDEGGGFHWRELYEEIRAGGTLTDERLLQIACNYSVWRDDWLPTERVELVEDPVPLAHELRYRPPAALDTLRRLMRFAETLVAQRSG